MTYFIYYYIIHLVHKKGSDIMPDQNNKIYLYEALELRAEYNSRLNTYKDLLPEAQNTSSGLWDNSDDVKMLISWPNGKAL